MQNHPYFSIFPLSRHALRRAIKRGISPAVVEFLLENGLEEYDGRCSIFHLRNREKREAFFRWAHEMGIKHRSRVLPYLVFSPRRGMVVTAGWRVDRVRHNLRGGRRARSHSRRGIRGRWMAGGGKW